MAKYVSMIEALEVLEMSGVTLSKAQREMINELRAEAARQNFVVALGKKFDDTNEAAEKIADFTEWFFVNCASEIKQVQGRGTDEKNVREITNVESGHGRLTIRLVNEA